MKHYKTFNISFLSILKFFLVILGLYFLYLIQYVLALIFVSIIFASAIDTWVDYLQNKKIPRGVSVLCIYLIIIAIISMVVVLIIPPIIEQFEDLSNQYPQYFEKVNEAFSSLKEYTSQLGLEQAAEKNEGIGALLEASQKILKFAQSVFNGFVSFLIILVITFYMTVEEAAIKRTARSLVPKKYQDFTIQLINKIQKKIGSWLKGQLILSLVIGVMTYIGLLILGVKYALVLALIAALGEFIPYIGPIISATPAVFLSMAQSPWKALFVIILFVVIQQLENHILVPKIMQKAVGLNPIISIIALLIGYEVGSILGAVLAIPVATAVSIILKEVFLERETLGKLKERNSEA